MVWLTVLVNAAANIVASLGDLDTIDVVDSMVDVSSVVALAAALALAGGRFALIAAIVVTKARC